MDARDVIAEALAAAHMEDRTTTIDEILGRLAADGYVIVRREQVGWKVGNSIGQEGSWYANVGVPVYVDVDGTEAST